MSFSTPNVSPDPGPGGLEIRRSRSVLWWALAGALALHAFLLLGLDWSLSDLLLPAALVAALGGFAWRLRDAPPVIVLDDEWMWDERWGLRRPISWKDVRSVREAGIGELTLRLEEPLADKPRNSGSLFRTQKSLSRLDTHAWGLEISLDNLKREILKRWTAARPDEGLEGGPCT